MQVVFDRQELLGKFETAAAIANSKSTKEVLQNVLLDLDNMRLEATDTETTIQVDIECTATGRVLLNTARFGAIIRESKSQTVALRIEERSLVVELENGRFTLPTLNPDEFPRLKVSIDKCVELEAKELARAITGTVFATDTDATRFQLGGVLFQFSEEGTSVVATDGRMLSYVALDETSDYQAAIVPVRPLQLVGRMTAGKDATCQVSVIGNKIAFRCRDTTLHTSLIEGKYPNWKMVIPQQKGERVAVYASVLLQAVRQAAIVCDDTNAVKLTFAGPSLSIQSSAAEKGNSSVTIPVEGGVVQDLILDHQMLQEWLKSLEKDSFVELFVLPSRGPLVLTSGRVCGVIMPMERR